MTGKKPLEEQILLRTQKSGKDYDFDERHDAKRPAQMWFQQSEEGEILFIVFYSQACRWSRCLGCNLPSKSSKQHVDFKSLLAQIDAVFSDPEVQKRAATLNKVIFSNNGSVLDEKTFSSTALIYFIAQVNLHFPKLSTLSLETRVEYVDMAELEFIARALTEGQTPTTLELAIGFEVFDDTIRNDVFYKGLTLKMFEKLCRMVAQHKFHLKCYFMQKPVPGMTDSEAIEDIRHAIDYLDEQAEKHGVTINMHLNPTYAAVGTPLALHFKSGDYAPPKLIDVATAALHAEDKGISIFLGLSDEGLACEGGSFIREGEEALVDIMETFNRTQDFRLLRSIVSF